jgi:TIR domain
LPPGGFRRLSSACAGLSGRIAGDPFLSAFLDRGDRIEKVGTQEEPPTRVSISAGAVFLSYASQDAEVAGRLCEALRGAGIEVWFDQSELRGGDLWDRQIREQIRECRLFIAVISAHTEARDEGYFRREWKLAIERTHDMADDKVFLVPIVVDATSERGARIPDPFRRVQWTRFLDGEPPDDFVDRVWRLLSPEAAAARPTAATPATPGISAQTFPLRRLMLWCVAAALVVALAFLFAARLRVAERLAGGSAANSGASISNPAPTAFSPPPHSVAVLPFENLSGDSSQEYFSDGMSEEVINALAQITALQVSLPAPQRSASKARASTLAPSVASSTWPACSRAACGAPVTSSGSQCS